MDPNDKNAGDEQTPAKKTTRKRAPSARKRSPKTVKAAEQQESTSAAREVGSPATARVDEQADGSDRSLKDPKAVSTPRAADQADPASDERFGEEESRRSSDSANDVKSWMDSRRDDHRGEVL